VAAAEQWRHGRGCSDSGEGRSDAEECVAQLGPTWSREGVEMVARLGEPAEGRARR
jgi:hypothetical protein